MRQSVGNTQSGSGYSSDRLSSHLDDSREPIKTDSDEKYAPSTAERLSQSPTTEERLANYRSPLAEGQAESEIYDLNPLTGPAGMAVRREFNGIPLRAENAYQAYSGMSANSFAGPDDIRLEQLAKTVSNENKAILYQMRNADDVVGDVYGRGKKPFSIFGKLLESPGSTVSDIKDLSGSRVDIKPTQPNFQEYYRTQNALADSLGDGMKLKKDYIKNPNPWGYTGRIHSTMTESNGLTHEIQVGSSDLSKFIDHEFTTTGGDRIALHDTTGYKGQIYGTKVPDHLQNGGERLR